MTGRQPELRWAHLTPLLPGPLAPSGLARHPLPVDVLAQFQLGCVQSRRRPAPCCHQHLLLLGGLCAHRSGAVQRPAQEGQAGHGEQWRGSGRPGERCGYDPPVGTPCQRLCEAGSVRVPAPVLQMKLRLRQKRRVQMVPSRAQDQTHGDAIMPAAGSPPCSLPHRLGG